MNEEVQMRSRCQCLYKPVPGQKHKRFAGGDPDPECEHCKGTGWEYEWISLYSLGHKIRGEMESPY